MPKYKVLARCFVNNGLHEEGEEIDFNGPKGSALELIEGERPAPSKSMDFPKKWGGKAKLEAVSGGE